MNMQTQPISADSMQAVATTVKQTTISKERPKTLKDMLMAYKNQMAAALPKHLTADRMLRIVMTEMNRNPRLKDCTSSSFIGSVLICCQLGLEPGPLGHAYLIPYKNSKLSRDSGQDVYECQFIAGYKGLVQLARHSGDIKRISAREVFSEDHFDYEFGLFEKCVHRPAEGDRGYFKGAYVVVELKDGSHQFEYMTASEINKIRDKTPNYSYWARNGQKGEPPIWEEHYLEMAKKTVFRRMSKYLPLSIEAQEAISLDERADNNEQRASLIIDGEIDKEDAAPMRTKSDELADKLPI